MIFLVKREGDGDVGLPWLFDTLWQPFAGVDWCFLVRCRFRGPFWMVGEIVVAPFSGISDRYFFCKLDLIVFLLFFLNEHFIPAHPSHGCILKWTTPPSLPRSMEITKRRRCSCWGFCVRAWIAWVNYTLLNRFHLHELFNWCANRIRIIFVNPSYLRKPAGRLGKVSPCEQSETLEGEGGAPKWPQKCSQVRWQPKSKMNPATFLKTKASLQKSRRIAQNSRFH